MNAESRPRKGRAAVEIALLDEGHHILVDAATRRRWMPTRLGATLTLLLIAGPLELGLVAGAMAVTGFSVEACIAVGAAAFALGLVAASDPTGWQRTARDAWWALRRGEAICIGETAGCRVFLPSELTRGLREYPVLVPCGGPLGGFAVNLTHHSLRGQVIRPDGQVVTLEQLRAEGAPDLLPVVGDVRARLTFGRFAVLIRPAQLPARPARQLLDGAALREAAFTGASLLVHIGLLILLVYSRPASDIQIRRSGNGHMLARLTHVESMRLAPEPEPVEEDEALRQTEELADEGRLAPAETTQAARVAPSLDPAPRRVAPSRAPSRVHRHPGDPLPNRVTRLSERYLPQAMIDQLAQVDLMGRGVGPRVRILGGDGGSPAPGGGAGSVFDQGLVGCTTCDRDDMGRESQPGGTRIAALEPTRLSAVALPEFTERNVRRVRVVLPAPDVSRGGLTKSEVRKYVGRQKGTVIHCYKQAVQRDPDLEGKVVVAFVISPNGSVMQARIASSTLGDLPTESCIVRRIKRWRFPQPLRGQPVRVRYPFLFRTR